MFETDIEKINAMCTASDKILSFAEPIASVEEIDKDLMRYDAIIMNLFLIYELNLKLSSQIKEQNPRIQWWQINDYRNKAQNEYFGVNKEEVWHIIKNILPVFNKELKGIAKD